MRHLGIGTVLALLVACGGGSDDGVGDTDPGGAPSLVGAWEVVDDGGGLDGIYLAGARFLVFRDDLSVEVVQENEAGQHDCPVVAWAPAGDDALLLTGARGGEGGGDSLLLLLERGDDGRIELVTSTGASLTLAPRAALTEAEGCRAAELAPPVTVDGQKEYWSNLVFDGTSLRLTTEDGAFALDPATGALTDPWTFGSADNQLPYAFQGDAPWNGCGCGASNFLVHTAPGGTELDTVNTDDLGGRLNIRGAAHDGTRLWVVGRDVDGRLHLRAMATAPEPDTLASDVPTALAVRALAFHQGALYAVDGDAVTRIDTVTARADADWTIPADEAGTSWSGIASDGTTLWIVGTNDEATLVTSVTLP